VSSLISGFPKSRSSPFWNFLTLTHSLFLKKHFDFPAGHGLGMIFLQGYCMPPEVAVWSATLPTDQKLALYCIHGGSVNQPVAGILE